MPSVYRHVKRLLPRDWWRYGRGVYPTFAAARQAIPAGRALGYEQSNASEVRVTENVRPSDYAAMFWLRPILPSMRVVFDLGGNFGNAYYVFQRCLDLPAALRWRVCDVPRIIEAANHVAAERNAHALEFTHLATDADGADLLYTSGALQYIPETLAELLGSLRQRPPYLLINRVPMTDRETFFTVQDIGSCQCPYRIANRKEFIDSITDLGYQLVDNWTCAESWCSVRFKPSRHVAAYSGCYFRARD